MKTFIHTFIEDKVLEKLKNKITKTFQLVYKNVETSENQQKTFVIEI